MTGISLRMEWPLTSQLHGSVSQRERLFFVMVGTFAFGMFRVGTAT
jgi:hypothetical protein